MPEIGSASLAVIPSFVGFQSKLENGTSKHMAAAGASGGATFGDNAGKVAGSRFKSHIKTAAKVAAVGLGLATAAAFKFAGDSLDEAREAQKVGALTESTIKATGRAARVTAKHVGDLSGRISKKVGIDDEAIQSGANMLLTFKNIRNEAGEGNKIFDQTLTTLVDLSSAMGTDAKTSAIQLGKALNDPVKGITALTRVGVTFTDQQKKQIEQMVKAGDVAGAQKVVLRELKSEFGGAAAAQATEADKLSVAWGNFKEEIGTQLIPVMDDLSKFLRKKGIPAAEEFIGWFKKDGVPALRKFGGYVKTAAGHAKDLVGWLNDLPAPAKIAGLTALFGGIAAAKLTGGKGGALSTVGKVAGLARPVRTFETNPAALSGGGPGGMGKKASTLALLGPVTLVAAGAITQKSLGLTPGQPFMPDMSSDGGKLKFAKTAAKLVEWWDKIRTATDVASDAVLGYNRSIGKVPTLWTTVFEAPGLARDKALVERYGSLLDGLDNRTITTFFKSVNLNKPGGEGESGTTPGQPPNRSGPGVVVNIGEVKPNNYNDFMTDIQNRTRNNSLDGVRQ